MTQLLERAFKEASKLTESEQIGKLAELISRGILVVEAKDKVRYL